MSLIHPYSLPITLHLFINIVDMYSSLLSKKFFSLELPDGFLLND